MNEATQCRKFWMHVLLRAQQEARNEFSYRKVAFRRAWQFKSRQWLTSNNPVEVTNFLRVCEFAGISIEDAVDLRVMMIREFGDCKTNSLELEQKLWSIVAGLPAFASAVIQKGKVNGRT